MVNVANGSSTKHLSEQFKILYNCIKKYVLKYTPEKGWQTIFNISVILA